MYQCLLDKPKARVVKYNIKCVSIHNSCRLRSVLVVVVVVVVKVVKISLSDLWTQIWVELRKNYFHWLFSQLKSCSNIGKR